MIKNIDELKYYTGELGRSAPALYDEIVLGENGASEDDLAMLSKVGDFPPSYLETIGTVGVFGVAIGYFALWPTFNRQGSLVGSLLDANSERTPVVTSARNDHLLIVGRQEANPICVGDASGPNPDEVILLDVMSSPEIRGFSVAQKFSDFLMLAANLNAISMSDGGDFDWHMAAIRDCCSYFNCTSEQSLFWNDALRELIG
jgi:hypothetical protein